MQLLDEYRDSQGHPWPVATAPADMLSDYNIVRQSTKAAIDGTGVIVFRAGYGTESSDTWRKVFSQLTSK
ncbi:MAG: hypothetical protein EXR53_06145 [Dehalococcoidia bacterium]|nr:hypothetical protein [Dehalococcoidia bacterium]